MKKYLLIFLMLSGICVFAQNGANNQKRVPFTSGIISGLIIDSTTGDPIEYGNVVLIRRRDNKVATGTVSKEDGKFLIKNINQGIYKIEVSFLGYATTTYDSIRISSKNPELDLGKIYLKTSSVMMNNITVTGDRNIITNKLDKKIINVDKMLTTIGGTALDVLQDVPSVNVDADGNISLRGNSNVKILIDGRPSGSDDVGASDVLTNLSASTIEKIELITNPSAKYEPEGTAGILNIILKKDESTQYSATANLNAGTPNKYNGGADFSVRYKKINVFGSYNGRYNDRTGSGTTQRTNYISDIRTIDQISSNKSKDMMNSVNTGFNIYPDLLNTISFNFQLRNMHSNGSNNLWNQYLAPTDSITREYSRDNNSTRNFSSSQYTLTYKRIIDEKGKELTLESNYNLNKMSSDQNTLQNELIGEIPSISQKNNNNNKNQTYYISGDYENPFGDNNKLEIGFKSAFKNLSTRSNYYTLDNLTNIYDEVINQKNNFNYDEQIHSGYLIYLGQFGNFSYQAGLRGEHVNYTIKLKDQDEEYTNKYFSLYPTMHMSYEFAEGSELLANYARRVDRPGNMLLNPYTDYSDSLNIVTGNPYLRPQYINSFELEYDKTLGRTTLGLTGFYKYTNNLISAISTLEDNGVTRTTYANISASKNYGSEFTLMAPVFSWLKLNANFSYFVNEFHDNGSTGIDTKYNSWATRINPTIIFSDDFQAQIFFMYSSPSSSSQSGRRGGGPGGPGGPGGMVSAQTKTKVMYSTDFAVKKDFFDKKLSLIFRAQDIFNTRKFNTVSENSQYIMYSNRKMDTRVFNLGISYRFNVINWDKDKDRKDEQDDNYDDL